MADFLSKILSVGPAVATGVGYAIGMGLAFAGQVPFILEAAALMTAKMAGYFRDFVVATGNVFSIKESPNVKSLAAVEVSEQHNDAKPKADSKLPFIINAHLFLEKVKSGLTTVKSALTGLLDFSSKIINAVGNGFLAIPSGVSVWLASITLGTATLNSLNFGFSGDVVSDAKAKEAQNKALDHNVKTLQGKSVQPLNQADVNVDPILGSHYYFNLFKNTYNAGDSSVPNDVPENGHVHANGDGHQQSMASLTKHRYAIEV